MAADGSHASDTYASSSSSVSTVSTSTGHTASDASLQSLPVSLLSVLTSFLSYSALLPLSSADRRCHAALFDSDVCWRCHPLVNLRWQSWARSSRVALLVDGRSVALLPPSASAATSPLSVSSDDHCPSCLLSLRHIRQAQLSYSLRSHTRRHELDEGWPAMEVARQLRPLRELSRLRAVRVLSVDRQLVVAQLVDACLGLRWLRLLELQVSGIRDAAILELASMLLPLCTPRLVHLAVLMPVAHALGAAGCLGSLQSLRLMGRLAETTLMEGETDDDFEGVERHCDRALLPSLTHLHVEAAHSLDVARLLEQLGDQLTFLSLSGWVTLPSSSALPVYSTLQSLQLDSITLAARDLQWLSLFPSLTQLSLVAVGVDADDKWRLSRADHCFLAGLPASLHYLHLQCFDRPNRADVELLFSPSHSRPFSRSLTHLWVDVPAAVVHAVSALLPNLPSLYPRLSHCHVRFDRYDRHPALRERYAHAWTACREQLGATWCEHESRFEQVRLDKQWRRAQILS